ncbi:MAG: hypothetical protein N3A61_01390, partial [Ignavibacteria bacterium]|nr:hypothetical protein [Ignavibacteria bacterium]
MISIISFAIFFVLFVSLFKKGTDVFSPARLLSLVWSFAIGLANLKLSRLQQEWTSYSWMMILLTIFSFLIGIYLIFVVNTGKKVPSINSIRDYFNS